ncbi:MAG TPA: hypothetical protein VF759_13730 [Allosphingosinicella sp.]|jgi:hypothetical protein
MPYRDLLRKTFADCGIARVAIVDDAFDEPNFELLEQAQFTALKAALDDLSEDPDYATLLPILEGATGKPLADIRGTLNEEATFIPLWERFVAVDPAEPLYRLLSPLFGALGTDKRDKLHPLIALRDLIKTSTDATVETFDSATTADDVLDFDMILLDFYLAEDVPAKPGAKLTVPRKKAARRRSINFLADLVTKKPDKTPLVMLISSMASPTDLPDFRDEANMLMSKMSFMPKEYAEKDIARAQHTILTLAKHRPHAEALVTLLSMWRQAVDEASKQLMVSVRELDLTDYSYLQTYRLASEKTPLAQYLTWLFSGQLVDLVERELREKKVETVVEGLSLPEPIPGLISPTPGIARVYSALTTSRIPIASGSFQPPAWAGDIYLETKRYNEIYGKTLKVLRRQKSMPEIMAVVTPACDLVPGRKGEKLRTVTMIGGSLVPLGDSVHPNVHLVMLNERPFVIMWNPKWPVTMSVDAMGPGSSMAGRYQWVGRLRDLYHAELQHKLMADISRVGLPVAPTMPEKVPVRILARTNNAHPAYETVLDHDAESGAAWTFAGETGKRSFCLRADVAWEVRRWVKEHTGTARPLVTLRKQVEGPVFLKDLQSPVHFGDKDFVSGAGSGNVRYRRVKDPMTVTALDDTVALVVAVGAG